MKTYALFAIKPDSADYCKGCLMASYPSDCVIERDLTEEALIARMAELDSKPLDYGEAGYDFTFIEEPEIRQKAMQNNDDESWQAHEAYEAEERRIQGLAKTRTEQLTEKRKVADQAKADAKKAADKAQAEAAERKQLQQLTAKYGEVKP